MGGFQSTDIAKPFLRRVRVRNFKSIGHCVVELRRLTILVGRNGSGKSNFLDAIRFVTDGLTNSLDHALRSRGGIRAVRRDAPGHPASFGVSLDFQLPGSGVHAFYGFEIAAQKDGGFSVAREHLEIIDPGLRGSASYTVKHGKVVASSEASFPAVVSDRLTLVVLSGIEKFRPAYDALMSMGFYNFNPDAMKQLQSPDAGELLHRDGSNIPSAISRIALRDPTEKTRAEEFLARIVPGIVGVDRRELGPRETLEFRQRMAGSQHPSRFLAGSMSDGTLRALGVLIAVAQLAGAKDRIRLVGIEEPETALHPAAANALMDALREATTHTQVLVTTHSPELLTAAGDDPDALLKVESISGETKIAPIDSASAESIRDHLYSAGDLLQMDQIEVDAAHVEAQKDRSLFDSEPDAEVRR